MMPNPPRYALWFALGASLVLLGFACLALADQLKADRIRHAQPIALCPRADTILTRHRMSSSGWPDSTLHSHIIRDTTCAASRQ